MQTINFWPILVASIVSFAIGALWYSPVLFGKEWMSLLKMNETDITEAKRRSMWKSYLSQFIATLVSFAVLAFFISSSSSITAADGAFIGFLAWLGFIAASMTGALLWEKKPFKLLLIDSVNFLIGLVIGGGIIGGWR